MKGLVKLDLELEFMSTLNYLRDVILQKFFYSFLSISRVHRSSDFVPLPPPLSIIRIWSALPSLHCCCLLHKSLANFGAVIGSRVIFCQLDPRSLFRRRAKTTLLPLNTPPDWQTSRAAEPEMKTKAHAFVSLRKLMLIMLSAKGPLISLSPFLKV